MAQVTDYASLSQAIQDFFVRTDLSSYVDYFIQMAEDTIYQDILENNDGRGIPPLETVLSGTIANNAIPVPADYLALRNAQINFSGSLFPLQRKNVEFIYTNYPLQSPTSTPAFIARQASNFIFGPYPDAAYTVQGIYWNRPPGLSSTNTTTWMLTTCASLLLAACCVAAATYLQDPDALQRWTPMYQAQLSGLLGRYKAEEWSGSALAMTPA